MKTKIEVLGYEIEIEENDGVVTVKAEFDGEVVEEFTLETPDAQDSQDENEGGDDDIKGFGDFDGQNEEEDFDGDFDESESDDDDEESDDEESDDDDDESIGGGDEVKLESFQSFFQKRK